jgi:hypothetical protein
VINYRDNLLYLSAMLIGVVRKESLRRQPEMQEVFVKGRMMQVIMARVT